MGKFDKKSTAARGGVKPAPRGKPSAADVSSNPEFRKIAVWLTSVKFKKKAVAGLDPVDVWKKLEELNRMYEQALMAERVRCDLRIEQLKREMEEKAIYMPPMDEV